MKNIVRLKVLSTSRDGVTTWIVCLVLGEIGVKEFIRDI